ncbi:MAG: outer membrane protein transport protein [Rhodoplanes sp.]
MVMNTRLSSACAGAAAARARPMPSITARTSVVFDLIRVLLVIPTPGQPARRAVADPRVADFGGSIDSLRRTLKPLRALEKEPASRRGSSPFPGSELSHSTRTLAATMMAQKGSQRCGSAGWSHDGSCPWPRRVDGEDGMKSSQSRALPLAVAAGVLCPAAAYAAGFALKEQSAAGLGSAFADQAAGGDGIAAMFVNPATITRQSGSRVSLIAPTSCRRSSSAAPAPAPSAGRRSAAAITAATSPTT